MTDDQAPGRGISGTAAARLIGVSQPQFSRAARAALARGVDLLAEDGSGWDPDKVRAWAGERREGTLSRAEVADILGLTPESVRRMGAELGELPRRPGARARYDRAVVMSRARPEIGARDGHGQYGVLDVDDVDGTILCHECGRRYQHLGAHLWMAHGVTAQQYRSEHGLSGSTVLVGPMVHERMRQAHQDHRLPAGAATPHNPGRRGLQPAQTRARRQARRRSSSEAGDPAVVE